MTPRILLRTAALGSLAAAASNPADPDFAPLIGAQVWLGQTWPSQSPPPGSGPLPNQLLLYGWEEKSESVSNKTTAPQFETTFTVVVEVRVETLATAASGTLPAIPGQAAIDNAIDGALDALAFATKKAVCQGIGVAAMALNADIPVIEEIRRIDTAQKYAESGQRNAGNGAVSFEIVFGEVFEPLIPNALDEIVVLINPTAGGVANPANAGNGTIGAVLVGLGAETGDYTVLFSSAGAFSVSMPDGSNAGIGAVGTPFAGGGLSFTISGGAQAFAAGDGFTVTVAVAAEDIITF